MCLDICTINICVSIRVRGLLLCTTKLAQSRSQYYFVLQSLHKALPSSTLYYKACTKHLPVLLCTTCAKHVPALLCTTELAQSTSSTKLAQSTSQYYFVLKSLHKARSQYYFVLQSLHKASFPVLLCTTKLAQSNSQYYFVLQSLRKTFPVRLCTTKLAQRRQRTSRNSRRDWGFAASPRDTATPEEKQRLRFRSFPHRHGDVSAAKRVFRARRPPILRLSTRYQTGWSVTKYHACHAKRHEDLLDDLQKGEVLQLPP